MYEGYTGIAVPITDEDKALMEELKAEKRRDDMIADLGEALLRKDLTEEERIHLTFLDAWFKYAVKIEKVVKAISFNGNTKLIKEATDLIKEDDSVLDQFISDSDLEGME